jgi:hypothetical protein
MGVENINKAIEQIAGSFSDKDKKMLDRWTGIESDTELQAALRSDAEFRCFVIRVSIDLAIQGILPVDRMPLSILIEVSYDLAGQLELNNVLNDVEYIFGIKDHKDDIESSIVSIREMLADVRSEIKARAFRRKAMDRARKS